MNCSTTNRKRMGFYILSTALGVVVALGGTKTGIS